jgi:hypothetical protein
MDPILYWNDVALEANRVSDLVQMGQGTGAGHSLPAPPFRIGAPRGCRRSTHHPRKVP